MREWLRRLEMWLFLGGWDYVRIAIIVLIFYGFLVWCLAP